MPGTYSANGDQTITATPGDTALAVEGNVLLRGILTELYAACEDTVTDNMIRWLVRLATALGTSTPVTPQPNDDGEAAAQLAGASNHTAEPTYAGEPFIDVPVHMRAVVRWKANRKSDGFYVPASATAAIGLTPIHATKTNNVRATFRWEE